MKDSAEAGARDPVDLHVGEPLGACHPEDLATDVGPGVVRTDPSCLVAFGCGVPLEELAKEQAAQAGQVFSGALEERHPGVGVSRRPEGLLVGPPLHHGLRQTACLDDDEVEHCDGQVDRFGGGVGLVLHRVAFPNSSLEVARPHHVVDDLEAQPTGDALGWWICVRDLLQLRCEQERQGTQRDSHEQHLVGGDATRQIGESGVGLEAAEVTRAGQAQQLHYTGSY